MEELLLAVIHSLAIAKVSIDSSDDKLKISIIQKEILELIKKQTTEIK